MERKRPVGLIIISIVEILAGMVGIWCSYDLLTHEIRTGETIGIAWLLVPLCVAMALLFFLGLTILLRKKVALIIHITGSILIPCGLVVVYAYLSSLIFGIWLLMSPVILIGFISAYYLTRPKVKEQFR